MCSTRPLVKMETAQVRGGCQVEDGTRMRASNNLERERKKKPSQTEVLRDTHEYLYIYEFRNMIAF